MKVVVLIENHTDNPALHAEHGLSFFIEKDGFRLLFDTGYSHLFIENANAMGIDLSSLHAIAFSHNHYDHCGGFLELVKAPYPTCPVYAHKGFFRRKWWDHSLDLPTDDTYEHALELVGPVMTPEYFFQHGYDKFRMISDDVFVLAEDIYLLGNFPTERGIETPHPSSKMELDPDTLVADTFRDEQICVVRTANGLVVISGCAHNGIVNILHTVEKRFPGESIYAVFGGTHLVQSTEPRITQTIQTLNDMQIHTIGVGHCTGPDTIAAFAAQVPAYTAIGSGFTWETE